MFMCSLSMTITFLKMHNMQNSATVHLTHFATQESAEVNIEKLSL